MTPAHRTTLEPKGRFSLAESIDFGFGQREAGADDVLRMAFVVDDLADQAAVAVRQSAPDTPVEVEVHGGADPAAVSAQVARVLSLTPDAAGWDALGATDPLLGRLQAARPGLRPPLFHSAYEAAAWCVLSARRPRAQMTVLRERLAAAHGATFEVAGATVHAFPTPEQLLAVRAFPGLPEVKLDRLHGVARAAADGRLDTATLRDLDVERATASLRELDGIGPLYASLVVIRALGHTDVPAAEEPLLLAVLGELLGRSSPVATPEFTAMAESWRPWRTWASVVIRAAGPRLLPADSVVGRRSMSR